jgi:hypothetical protein
MTEDNSSGNTEILSSSDVKDRATTNKYSQNWLI